MTKILYLSYDGITDQLGQSQILPYLIGLSAQGQHFHLIGLEKKEVLKTQAREVRKAIEGKPIEWIPLRYHKSPPILSTIYDIWKMRQVANKVIQESEIPIVHCRSYIPMLVGVYLKKKHNVKLIFDMRGFWADERVDGKIWNLKNPIYHMIYSFFKRKEMTFVREADYIISLTKTAKKELISGNLFTDRSLQIEPQKIFVIPCATDLNLFDPDKVSGNDILLYRENLSLSSNDKILLYLGSLGTWYLVREMLIFYKYWKSAHHDFKFLFVTKDDMREVYRCCQELGIKTSDILHCTANRNEIPVYLKMADLGVFFIKPAYSKKASSAVKMGEMMAMGLPFVTNKGVGDQDALIKEFNCGISIDLSNMEVDVYPKNCHHSTLKISHFNIEKAVSDYLLVYRKLTD